MTKRKQLRVSVAKTPQENARIILNGKEFWTTPKGFLAWVRTGLIQAIDGESLGGQLLSKRASPTQIVKYSISLDDNIITATWFENDEHRPPWFAEYLIYFFMTKEDRKNIIGDLREEYAEVLLRFGDKGARVWFYKQALTSLFPLASRFVVKWGLFGWLRNSIRRFIS